MQNSLVNRVQSEDLTVYKEHAPNKSLNNPLDETGQTLKIKHISILSNLCLILKQKIFIFSACSLASLFFVITAVQYWGSDYIKNVLLEKDDNKVLLSFTIVCVSSPTLGVIFGGFMSTKLGGYESKHSILLCVIFALFACVFSIPVPLVSGVVEFTVFLWFVLFFGGAILPPITGIIITTLPRELRGSANSITAFFSILFGYLPAPFVYGIINKSLKETYPYLAMMIVMYWSLTGLIFLIIAAYYRYKFFNLKRTSIKTALVEERKLSKLSRVSIISNTGNIARVFGGFLIMDLGTEIVIDDGEDSDNNEDNKSIDNENAASNISNAPLTTKSEKNKKTLNSIPADSEKNNESEYAEFQDKKNNVNFSSHISGIKQSLHTPVFNLLNNSDELEYVNNKKHIEQISNVGSNYNKEESIFGIKQDIKEENKNSISGYSSSEQEISKSYKEREFNNNSLLLNTITEEKKNEDTKSL